MVEAEVFLMLAELGLDVLVVYPALAECLDAFVARMGAKAAASRPRLDRADCRRRSGRM